MLKDYERPLYIHVGNIRTGMSLSKKDFNFELLFEDLIM